MSCLYVSKFAGDHFYHYFNPGVSLTDDKLRELHQTILNINRNAKVPLNHKLLEEVADIAILRERYSSMIVCLIKVDDIDSGFLISPILQNRNLKLIHAGLVMINHNRGTNLLALAGSGTVSLAYKKLGTIYSTNISSTPAIIEAYSMLTSNCWPTPKANLIRAPQGYLEVAQTLFHDYVKKYFPNPENVTFDPRRFVIHSDSRKMGFNTDFRQISRSSSFEFLNFCFTWIDYDKEEDLLQVGVIDRQLINRVRVWRLLFSWRLMKKLWRKRLSSFFQPKNTATIAAKELVK